MLKEPLVIHRWTNGSPVSLPDCSGHHFAALSFGVKNYRLAKVCSWRAQPASASYSSMRACRTRFTS
jgi:hypothetical protein